MLIQKKIYWLLWAVFTMAMAWWLGKPLMTQKEQQMYLVGKTTHGHHQIEMECSLCHTSPFGGRDVLQDACVSCHGSELKAVSDSHPKSKFTDPRNADRVKILDARYCITCHREHQEGITESMGVTMPQDYCFSCHQNIGKDRPSHKGLDFNTCASSGCHNYHDNLALYENFLLENSTGLTTTPNRQSFSDNLSRFLSAHKQQTINVNALDMPAPVMNSVQANDWHQSSHAKANVSCLSCHQSSLNNEWVTKPSTEICATCHAQQSETFLQGKHGMRIKAGLSPMMPSMARAPMKAEAAMLELGCTSCHNAHDVNDKKSTVTACSGCHDSAHTLAFEQSPHGLLYQQAIAGDIPWHEAVTCATCHLPAMKLHEKNGAAFLVNHNQNEFLRPNEKMIRPVCMNCHSLEFSIDSLADPALIQNNFNGQPSRHIPSIDMAKERDANRKVSNDIYH